MTPPHRATGRNMRRRRERAGIHVEELAADLEISPATLADWEAGHYLPIGNCRKAWETAVPS